MPCISRSVKLTYGYWNHNAYFVSEDRRTDPDTRGKRTIDESLQELSANHRHDDNRQGDYEWGGRIAFDGPAGVTEPSGN